MKASFLCPIPWVSLSMGSYNSPRLCCHQTAPHSLPTPAISTLLDLPHGQSARSEMLAGKVPSACMSCLELEQAGCQSPRQDYLKRFPFDVTDKPVIRYLDLTIDNDCNLECVMCSPNYSARLGLFFEQKLAGSPTERWSSRLTNADLVKMFPSLEQITITGGEPFLSARFKEIINFLCEQDQSKNIVLRVFTNLTRIPVDLMKKLDSFKRLELILSIDSVGSNYEFMRYPAKWDVFLHNLDVLKSLNMKHTHLHFHAVITAINWLHIGELIDFFRLNLPSNNIIPVFVEIESPIFLHPKVLSPEEYARGKKLILEALVRLRPQNAIHQEQIQAFNRLIDNIDRKNHHNKFIDYHIYLQKIKSHRQRKLHASGT